MSDKEKHMNEEPLEDQHEESSEKTTDISASSSYSKLATAGWITIAAAVLVASVLGGWYWNSHLKVQSVAFKGNYFVDTQTLQQAVSIPADVKPDSLNFMRLISDVEQIPYVKQADANVSHGGTLIITVKERQPIALLEDGEQKIYVDQDGIKLPIVLEKAVDVPLLYGFRGKPMDDTLKSEAFRHVRNFLVDAKKDPVSWATISEVAYTQDKGIVALSHENGVKLVFGTGDYERKLTYWKTFYAKVIRKKGIDHMATVDLRFKGQIVTRES